MNWIFIIREIFNTILNTEGNKNQESRKRQQPIKVSLIKADFTLIKEIATI